MASKFRNIDNPGGKRKILSVRIVRDVDGDADISHLGTYAQHEKAGAVCIDRRARGDWARGEYPWFICAMSGEESGNPDSPEQDYARAEAFGRGAVWMCGVYAESSWCSAGGAINEVRSPGLWGIESDSGADYFADVARDELTTLRGLLAECGFGARAINAAFKAAGLSDKAPAKAVQRG